MSANCFSFCATSSTRIVGVNPLVCTMSGHLQFFAVWCPPICGHPSICLYCLKCTKFYRLVQHAPNSISARAPPQTPLREQWSIQCPQTLAVFKGPTFMGKEETGSEGGGKTKKRGAEEKREEQAKGREGKDGHPYFYLASATPLRPHWRLLSQTPGL